jgi:cytochrome c553
VSIRPSRIIADVSPDQLNDFRAEMMKTVSPVAARLADDAAAATAAHAARFPADGPAT